MKNLLLGVSFISFAVFAAGLAAWATESQSSNIVFDGPGLRAVLGKDAAWKSLVHKATGKELIAGRTKFAAATFVGASAVQGAGTDGNVIDQQKLIADAASKRKTIEAARASFAGDSLTIGFEGVDCELSYSVTVTPDGIIFKLIGVSGRRPRELELVRIEVTPMEHVGPRLAAGWDATMAAGLVAVNLQSQAAARKKDNHTFISASTQDAPGPRLEGSGVALVAAPPAEYRAMLCRLSGKLDLPRNLGGGVPSKELPAARDSYWFLSFGEADVEKVIDCCRQSGFHQVMLSSGSWCALPGHYVFNTKMYPDGQESLRRAVERLHAAGIKVGMHCYASKIAKADAYVTPVPDKRFWVDRETALAEDIGESNTEIRVTTDLREWPGSPVASQKLWEGGVEKHREVIIDNEIIQFKSIGPEGKWDTFQECKRGAFKTQPATHKAGTAGRHYGVDGCINGYIIDQDTDLLDEVTTRLAGAFNDCGFDMVYFDGGEDVDRRRFVHYVSKFQAESVRKFTKRPIIHMGTIMTHNLWHSFTRSGTVDTYMNTLNGHIQAGGTVETWPTVRSHIDKSVEYMLSIGDDMMPGELGWFGIWPKGKNTDGLQLDEAEYLMVKSLAYNAPISLQTSFSQMAKHPFTSGIMEIVRTYEELRTKGILQEAVLVPLRAKNADFALVRSNDAVRFVRLEQPFHVAEGVRASVGGLGDGAVGILWGSENAVELRLPVAREGLRAEFIGGEAVEVGGGTTEAVVQIGPRRLALYTEKLVPAALKDLLGKATVSAKR
jgi:hypothetical protein